MSQLFLSVPRLTAMTEGYRFIRVKSVATSGPLLSFRGKVIYIKELPRAPPLTPNLCDTVDMLPSHRCVVGSFFVHCRIHSVPAIFAAPSLWHPCRLFFSVRLLVNLRKILSIMSTKLNDLPFDVWCVIAPFCSTSQVLLARLVSKQYFRYLSSNDIWDALLVRDFSQQEIAAAAADIAVADGPEAQWSKHFPTGSTRYAPPQPGWLQGIGTIKSLFLYWTLSYGRIHVRVRPSVHRERQWCGCIKCLGEPAGDAKPCVADSAIGIDDVSRCLTIRLPPLSDVDAEPPALKSFSFCTTLGPSALQIDAFNAVDHAHICRRFRQGKRHTLLAYGQTGAGKTHTMLGEFEAGPRTAGLCPRILAELFDSPSSAAVNVSIFEIYNEHLRDLLFNGLSKDAPDLRLRQAPGDTSGLPDVENSVVFEARSYGEVMEALDRAMHNRSAAHTGMSTNSSRSHLIIDVVDPASGGRLRFFDLAGSERLPKTGASGLQLREARAISISLTSLGRVVDCIARHQPHIPLRDSKLSRLLSDMFGWKSTFDVFAVMSPAVGNAEESLNTARFASKMQRMVVAMRLESLLVLLPVSLAEKARKAAGSEKRVAESMPGGDQLPPCPPLTELMPLTFRLLHDIE